MSKQNESERHFRGIYNLLLSVLPTPWMDSSPWVTLGHQLLKVMEGSAEGGSRGDAPEEKLLYVKSLPKKTRVLKYFP